MLKFKICIVLSFVLAILGGVVVMAEDKPQGTYLSPKTMSACYIIGEEYGVCPELLMAIVEKESSGKKFAVNGDCVGLMQISTKWHKERMERLGVTDICDEYSNILVGTDYLMELAEEYGDIGIVLMAYNGDSRVKKAMNGECDISNYAKWILKRSEELERAHGK